MNENQLALLLLIFLIGSALGAIAHWIYQYLALGGFKQLSAEIINRAEHEASDIRRLGELSLHQKQLEQQNELEKLRLHDRKKIMHEEERLKQREDKLESRMNLVEKKLSDIEKKESILIERKVQLEEERKI